MTKASKRRLFNKGKLRKNSVESDNDMIGNKRKLSKRRKKNKISAKSRKQNRKG